jgi:hypothetical protein
MAAYQVDTFQENTAIKLVARSWSDEVTTADFNTTAISLNRPTTISSSLRLNDSSATINLGAGGGNSGGLTFNSGAQGFKFVSYNMQLYSVSSPIITLYTAAGSNNVGINTSSDQSAKLAVKGSGTTSSTTSFLVQDSSGNTSLQVKDDKTTTFGAPIYLSGNQGYIYYSSGDYIRFPRQGGPAPGYFSNSTAGDGWAFRLDSNNQTYARIMEGSFYLEAYTPNSNGRNNIRTWFSGSNFVYIDGDGVTGYSPSYGNGVNVIIRGGKSGTYSNVDNRGAAGYVTVEGGSAYSGSSTTHVPAAGVNIQTGLGLGTGSVADITFSTSATSSVASVYHTLPQRMIIKGQTGYVGIGTSTPSSSLHISGASAVLTLSPQDPLPSGVPTGSFAVSSSAPPKPYFYDGTTWNALY